MATTSREKKALGIFALLIACSLGALVWYLVAGHSWNRAATTIDDTFGSMDDYTVILYDGHALAPADSKSEHRSLKIAAEEASPTQAAPSFSIPGLADVISTDEETPSASSTTASNANSLSDGKSALPLTAEEVCESYEKKGACAFVLNLDTASRYVEGIILKRGAKRIGVASAPTIADRRTLRVAVDYFERAKVDMIIAVTPQMGIVKGVAGIDVAICTQESLLPTGETIKGTLFVSPPDEGCVGAILVSPSNVVSTKVIKEL